MIPINAATNPSPADPLTGYGAINRNYSISDIAVMVIEFETFLGSITPPYPITYTSDIDPQTPVRGISWREAAMYCNYITTGYWYLGFYNFDQQNCNLISINRSRSGINYALPTTDEWYRAAYYNQIENKWHMFANESNTKPNIDNLGDGSNYGDLHGGPWSVYNGGQELNGTYNMMGNVWEWCEDDLAPGNKRIMGGSFNKPFIYPPKDIYPADGIPDWTYLLRSESQDYVKYMIQDTSFINICSRRVAGLDPQKKDSSVGFRIVEIINP